jgi:hypothetical protein
MVKIGGMLVDCDLILMNPCIIVVGHDKFKQSFLHSAIAWFMDRLRTWHNLDGFIGRCN